MAVSRKEQMKSRTKDSRSASAETEINYRRDYACSGCERSGIKLWRDYSALASHCELKCAECATPAQVAYEAKNYTEQNRGFLGALDPDGLFTFRAGDQLGGLVPAVPTPDGETFWGYSAVPNEDVLWWYGWPTYQDADRERRCLQQLFRKTVDKYVSSRQQALRLRGKIDEARRRLRYRVEGITKIPAKLSLEELVKIVKPQIEGNLENCRLHLIRLMGIQGDLMKMVNDLYDQVYDLEWQIERRVFEFTRPAKVLIYDTEVHESEGLRVYAPVEKYRDVGTDDRVAFTEGRERAYLLDLNDRGALRKAHVIMEHAQDGERWIREQLYAGVLCEIRRGHP